MNFQNPVVVDHPPQELPGIELAFPEVNRPLGREMELGEFIFILRDRDFVVCRRRNRESGPSLRALVCCWDRDIDDGGRRVWPQVNPGVLVDFGHAGCNDRIASTESDKREIKVNSELHGRLSRCCWNSFAAEVLKAKEKAESWSSFLARIRQLTVFVASYKEYKEQHDRL